MKTEKRTRAKPGPGSEPRPKRLKVDPESAIATEPKVNLRQLTPVETKPSLMAKTEVKQEQENMKPESAMMNTDSESEALTFEERRLKNLQDNAEFLAQLGIYEAKHNLNKSMDVKKPKPTSRGFKEKRVHQVLPLRPKSLRLQRITPTGVQLPDPEPEPVVEEHPRKPSGPLEMSEHLNNVEDEKSGVTFIDSLKARSMHKVASKQAKLEDLSRYVEGLEKMTITEERVAKLVPKRIFGMAIHPSQERVLVAAGGKWGELGVWDVESDLGSHDGVFCFTPHSRPINCLQFHPNDPQKLYSGSYDGTIRCGVFEKGVFDEVFATPEEYDTRVSSFAFQSPDVLVASQSDGDVAIVDVRTPGTKAEHLYTVTDRSLKCVDVHPVQSDYIATASTTGLVEVWDVRNIKGKRPKHVASMNHGRSVDSAYFSPVTGKYLLTTSINDRLELFDCSEMGPKINSIRSCRHDNHTGRWLTNFRATWHPRREDIFVVGSMVRPRQIEIFNDKMQIVKKFRHEEHLGSVCSLNVFHPTRNIIAGGNSSGRVHVFMD